MENNKLVMFAMIKTRGMTGIETNKVILYLFNKLENYNSVIHVK